VKTTNTQHLFGLEAVITILTKYSLKLNFYRPLLTHSRNVLHIGLTERIYKRCFGGCGLAVQTGKSSGFYFRAKTGIAKYRLSRQSDNAESPTYSGRSKA